ncbi:MAG: signal peptidase I [Planctomycetes bacterium]|nr:signal peptidase I [Planctomycetota bacterium]
MTDKPKSPSSQNPDTMTSFKETLESLIIAFILAFVFRAFTVEAFIIPTGSMADTLRGAHFRLTCPTCGHPFNLGWNGSSNGERIPTAPEPVASNPQSINHGDFPICPLCGTRFDADYEARVSNGDRILVLKYLYFLSEPQTWDVVVFKNPTDPTLNFIKRLIGKPGDKVELIDGDVYLDDKIQRKPDHVQNVLWIPIYHSDHQPPTEAPGRRDKILWDSPFQPENPAGPWNIDQHHHQFTFTGSDNLETINFNRNRLRKSTQSFLAYNSSRNYSSDFASDLKMAFTLTPDSPDGAIAIKLGKYNRIYRAEINFDGDCRIINESDNHTLLLHDHSPPLTPGVPIVVTYANLDHSLILTVGENKLQFIGDDDPQSWGYDPSNRLNIPSVALTGNGPGFSLEHIALARDVHYTNAPGSNGEIGAATEGNPFTLAEDEFFVLGDNSPQSHDSRYWDKPNPLPNDKQYRQHIVPRDYLIGKAFFVYWPAGFHIHQNVRFALIPNIGEMRFIH